jgi:hypothetical protein
MIARILSGLVLTTGLVVCVAGLANAQPTTSTTSAFRPTPAKAPELDPTALGGGITMLAGGLLMFGERRRKNV